MKRLIIILFLLIGFIVGAQTTAKTKLTKPGINSNIAITTTSEKINLLSNVTSDVQTQLDNKINAVDSINPFTYIYTKAQVDSINRRVIAIMDGRTYSHTGNTTKTVIFTGTLPGGVMGANGSMYITALFAANNTANSKNIEVQINGVPIGSTAVGASGQSNKATWWLINQNSTTSQKGGPLGTTGASFGSTSTAVVSTSINTDAPMTFTISYQLTVGTDTGYMYGIMVEIIKGTI